MSPTGWDERLFMLERKKVGTCGEILSKPSTPFPLSLSFCLSIYLLIYLSIYLSLPGALCPSHSLIFALTENALTPDLSKLHIID